MVKHSAIQRRRISRTAAIRIGLATVLAGGLLTTAIVEGVAHAAAPAGTYPGCGLILEGQHGNCVRLLQHDLNRANSGYHLREDGVFTVATRKAVLDFQGRNHLPADGNAGPVTVTKLRDQAGRTAVASPRPGRPLDGTNSPEGRGLAVASPSLRIIADRYMNMDYQSFVNAKAQRPNPSPFNWTDNGCSGPKQVRPVYRELFNKACQLHDFGYRNYGQHADGLRLGTSEATRKWIDDRLLTEMQRKCHKSFDAWWQLGNKQACLREAGAMYNVLRIGGEGAFRSLHAGR